MRHLRKGRKFGRVRKTRRALMKSLASSFFMTGRIKTTEAKAKELRPLVEKAITRGKNPILANVRLLRGSFSEEVVKKILTVSAVFKERKGGYTRITKVGRRRIDGTKMAIIELIVK